MASWTSFGTGANMANMAGMVGFPSFAHMPALLGEQRYRRAFFDADRKQRALVVTGITVGSCLAVRNDLALLQGTAVLRFALLCRLITLVALAVTLVLLRRAGSPRQQDRVFDGWLAAWSILQVMVLATRRASGECLGPLIGQGAVLATLYFALWGPIGARAVWAGITSAAVLVLLWMPGAQISHAGRYTGTAMLIATNLGGVIAARASEENRRKRFEAERRLAVKVRELAAEKERAEATSRARAAFLAAMSHEFRTPMNAVIGLSELVLDTRLSDGNREHVRNINESARGLLALLEDILDFAKIDANKVTFSPAPFDLRRLAASVADMLRPAAGARDLSLSLDLSPDVPEALVGDAARIRQVLVNLVGNAVKFTERGEVTLRIGARALGGGDHELAIRVEDTGPGMTADVLSHLFRPFEQGDGGIARRHGGTGLGLAISEQIVRAMGGEIHVESTPRRGSVFSFALRLAAAPPMAAAARPAPRADRPPLSILVVDDHPINREVARAKLVRMGHSVELACDGAEAIAATAKRDFDVVFMDLQMPGMSGIEATARILAGIEGLAGRRAPHVIAMTASVFEADRDACRRAGMRDFVGKPIDRAQIDAVLARVAEERGAAAPVLSEAALAKVRQIEVPGETGFFAELCEIFKTDTRERLARIDDALARGDTRAIEDEAHALRSASATLGATEMSELCRRIEVAAIEGRVEELTAFVRALSSKAELVQRALSREAR